MMLTLQKNIRFFSFAALFTSTHLLAMEPSGPFCKYPCKAHSAPTSIYTGCIKKLLTPTVLNTINLTLPMPDILHELESFIGQRDDIKDFVLSCCSDKVVQGALKPVCIQEQKRQPNVVTSSTVIDSNRVLILPKRESDNRNAWVCDSTSGKRIKKLRGHTNWVVSVAAIDSNRAVTTSSDMTARIWNVNTGQCIQVLEGHTGCVTSAAVIDSNHIMTASFDNTVRVWNINTGQCIQVLEGHTNWVRAVEVINSNRITTSDDNITRVWFLPSTKTLTLAQLILLIKLEYAQQNNKPVFLSADWATVFDELQQLFRDRYDNIIDAIIRDVQDNNDIDNVINTFCNMTL